MTGKKKKDVFTYKYDPDRRHRGKKKKKQLPSPRVRVAEPRPRPSAVMADRVMSRSLLAHGCLDEIGCNESSLTSLYAMMLLRSLIDIDAALSVEFAWYLVDLETGDMIL